MDLHQRVDSLQLGWLQIHSNLDIRRMQSRLPSLAVDKVLVLPGSVLQNLRVRELLLDQVGLGGLLVVLETHLDNGSTNLALRLDEWERLQQPPPISFRFLLMSDRCVRSRPTVALGAPVEGLAVVRFGLIQARRGRRQTPRALIVAATVPSTSSTACS